MNMAEAPLNRLWKYAQPYRGRVVTATLWSFLNKAMDIAPPFLIGMAIDVVVRQEDSFLASLGIADPRTQLVVLAAITFVVWALESLFEYLQGVAWRNLAQTIQHDLRVDTYTHMQNLELAFFEDRRSGDLMAVLNDDVNQLERFLDIGANEVIQMFTTVVLIGASFFIIAPSVAWLAFLPVPVIIWGSFRFQRRIEPRYEVVREQAAAINSLLSNNVGGIATIKAFTAERREVERITEESDRYRAANAAAITLSSAFSPLIRVAILVGFTATLIWGGFLVLDGALSVGLYSVMVFLTQRLLWPLTRLGQTFDLYQRAMASSKRIFGVLDTEPRLVDGSGEPAPLVGSLALNSVDFSYDDGYPVLTDVTIDIPAGQTTAFVGPTGSGKTTLIKLLLRFYDPGAGTVMLDGVDLRTIRRFDVRRAMALVSQDVFLFHGSVAENIAYGKPEATAFEIREAAQTAEAHDFIESLPFGYDTIVGERGQKLSGGQRQRLSIARALVTGSPILLLDEATSAVDNETEAAIQRSLGKVAHDRTVVVIAHRLSTIRHADRIYVVGAGTIVESGTHDELVDHPGIYRSLWDVQTGSAVSV
ncbi:MAG: ABC transporter ATP-binding protein/permease [Acidimicrobiia bacterium]|nr:ABC transporter ATP-binding protein/permease [Acidimicrobiia bacterium]